MKKLIKPITVFIGLTFLAGKATTVLADESCENPSIYDHIQLVRHALLCNGEQQALDAQWQAQTHHANSVGYLDDPKLMLGIAPKTLDNNEFDDGFIVELSQPLPWPGVLELRKQAATDAADALKSKSYLGQIHLAKQIRLAYAQWQYHRRLLEINSKHQTLWHEFLAVVRAKYASGTGTKSAILQATHEHHVLKQEAIELSARIERAISELRRLGNFSAESKIVIDELPITQFTSEQLDSALAGLNLQPSIQAIESHRHQKNKQLLLAEKDRYPSFNAFARYNSLWMNDEQQWVVGVGFNLPFDFGKRTSREDKIKAEQLALRWQQQDTLSLLRETLIQSFSHWQESIDVYQLYQNDLLPLAEENMATARDEYRSGSGDFLSFLTAQRQLLTTEKKSDQALRDQFAFHAQLLAATGLIYPNEINAVNGVIKNTVQENTHE